MAEYIMHESGALENGDFVIKVNYFLNGAERRALTEYAKHHNISVESAIEEYAKELQQIVEAEVNKQLQINLRNIILKGE